MQFAWFEQKLQNKKGAVDAALSIGKQVCLSLGEDDAVAVPQVTVGGTPFAIDSSIPQFNAVLGIGGAVLGSGEREALLATQALFTAPAGGAIIAGIPKLEIDVAGLSGLELGECVASLPVQTGCDPILFLGVGHRKAGMSRWDLIDDQLTPIRGFKTFDMEMTGIAERLAEGDELALLVYGFHAQYPVTWSRDILVPALNLSGQVLLPLLQDGGVTAILPSS